LHVTAEVHAWNGAECTFKGTGTVDGASAVSAKITLERYNLAERDPKLKSSDEMQIQAARELFSVLWSGEPSNLSG
jgi:3-hydroxyacyl-[acyl-carrier-protein] dehydratase